MRRLLPALLLLALPLLLAAIPMPTVKRFTGSARIAPDSSVIAGTRIAGLKGTIAGDSMVYRYWRGTVLVLTQRKAITVLADSGRTLVAPAYAETITYKGCADVKRLGVVDLLPIGCWTWVYARAAPLPSADSVIRLSSVRVPVLLPRPAMGPCPAGWSCAQGTPAAVTLPRYTYVRLQSGRDSVAFHRGMAPSGRTPVADAFGVIDTGFYSYQDGQRFALVVCTAAERFDGKVVWTATSATRAECAVDASPVLATRYGARWMPALPAAGGVAVSVSQGAGGWGIIVEQPASGLSLSLALARS